MGWRRVSAKRLRRRELVFTEGPRMRATVFPFFDRTGAVSELLLVAHDEGGLLRMLWEPQLVSVPVWGPIRMRCSRRALRPVEVGDGGLLPLRWHFDPWWMLAEEPFDQHPMTPALKATNAVAPLGTAVRAISFRRDLGQVERMLKPCAPHGEQWVPWHEEVLPACPTPPPSACSGAGHQGAPHVRWVLAPPWGQQMTRC